MLTLSTSQIISLLNSLMRNVPDAHTDKKDPIQKFFDIIV